MEYEENESNIMNLTERLNKSQCISASEHLNTGKSGLSIYCLYCVYVCTYVCMSYVYACVSICTHWWICLSIPAGKGCHGDGDEVGSSTGFVKK